MMNGYVQNVKNNKHYNNIFDKKIKTEKYGKYKHKLFVII